MRCIVRRFAQDDGFVASLEHSEFGYAETPKLKKSQALSMTKGR
jgi:hypothetical protein